VALSSIQLRLVHWRPFLRIIRMRY